MGNIESGKVAMKAASRTSGVMIAGVAGFATGGPVGAGAAGIAGGAAMDGIITGCERYVHGPNYRPHGYFAVGEKMYDACNGTRDITSGEWFDVALTPVFDCMTGYFAGEFMRNRWGKGKDTALDSLGLDKKARDNRANQLNPNHDKSGPGKPRGYQGSGTQADLNNHANQMNPNNPAYEGTGKGKSPSVTPKVEQSKPFIPVKRVDVDETDKLYM